MDKPFRLGVVFDSTRLLAYEKSMLEQLEGNTDLELLLYSRHSDLNTSPTKETAGYRLVRILDTVILGEGQDPFANTELPENLKQLSSPNEPHEDQLDIVLALSSMIANAPDYARSSLHGALFFNGGETAQQKDDPEEFWEVLNRQPNSTTTLKRIQPTGEQSVIAESHCATDWISPIRNRSLKYWKAGSLIPRTIQQIKQEDKLSPTQSLPVEALDKTPHPTVPDSLSAVGHLVRHLPRVLQFYRDAKLANEQWYLRFQHTTKLNINITQFKAIYPPDDRLWADPHVVERHGKHYIFVEEMLFTENKGYISVMELDANGNHSTPVKVLERDFHLSYPQLIKHKGKQYMLPEASASNRLTLYRCTEFPHSWEEETVLMDNVVAVDASLLHEDNKWWLFMNLRPHELAGENDELHLFYREDLLRGKWHPHPLNPIVSDVRRARPAGKIFKHNGHWIRPSQDCSRYYGYGLNLNQITGLSETNYAEKPIASVNAGVFKQPAEIGTHTIAREGELTVVDACRHRPKLPFFRKSA